MAVYNSIRWRYCVIESSGLFWKSGSEWRSIMFRPFLASLVVSAAMAPMLSAAVVETTRSALSIGPVGAVHPHMALQGSAGAPDAARQGPASHHDVYPGIGVEYYFRDGEFEYDFHVSPGADPSVIRLTFPAARRVSIAANGDLLVEGAHDTVRHRRPFSYQTAGAGLVEVPSAFRIVDGAVTFQLSRYDRSRPLVIDPKVVYSTPVTVCCLQAIATDGSVYYGGSPATGATATDAVVQKLSPQRQLVYTLRLNSPQTIAGMAVDGAGAVYFNGPVNAASPPALVNPAKATPSSAYLAKIRPDGSGFAIVTYYEGVTGPMTVAADGNIFIGGGRGGTLAAVKLDPAGNVAWTYDISSASTSAGMTSIASEGTSVFFAGWAACLCSTRTILTVCWRSPLPRRSSATPNRRSTIRMFWWMRLLTICVSPSEPTTKIGGISPCTMPRGKTT